MRYQLKGKNMKDKHTEKEAGTFNFANIILENLALNRHSVWLGNFKKFMLRV